MCAYINDEEIETSSVLHNERIRDVVGNIIRVYICTQHSHHISHSRSPQHSEKGGRNRSE